MLTRREAQTLLDDTKNGFIIFDSRTYYLDGVP